MAYSSFVLSLIGMAAMPTPLWFSDSMQGQYMLPVFPVFHTVTVSWSQKHMQKLIFAHA